MFKIKNWSLKVKILVLTELVLMVLAAVSVMQVYNLEMTQKQMSAKSLQGSAVNLGTPLGKMFRLKYNQVQALALNRVFETKNPEEIQKILNAFVALNDGYDAILFVDTEGALVAANSENSSGSKVDASALQSMNFKGKAWFDASLAEQFSDDEDKLLMGTYVEAFQVDEIRKSIGREKAYGSSFSTAVKNSAGEIIGVLSTRVQSSWLETAFTEMYNGLVNDGYKSARLLITDGKGNVVVDFEPAKNKGELTFDYSRLGQAADAVLAPGLAGIKDGTASFFEISREGEQRVVGFSSLIYDVLESMSWGVMISIDQKELIGSLSDSILLFYIAVLGILLASMVVVWFVVDRISKSLAQVVYNLKNRVDVSMQTSTNLSHVSNELAAGSTEQAAAVQETVASMTEMTSMINQTAQHVEESERLAMEVNARTQQGAQIMQNMVSSMETIQQANEELHEMKLIIGEIADKTKVINDIVFKTQLLSFNASIEAARAGQHGRGFAVVAEEVGNLAQMSGNAANEIATLLHKSQAQVEQIVENTKVRVSEGQAVSGQAMSTFSEIAEEIELIASKVKSIQDATREQEEGVRQVSITMKQIDETTQANSNLATSASNHAVGVKEEAEKLESIMKKMTAVVMGGSASIDLSGGEDEETLAPRSNKRIGKLVGRFSQSEASQIDVDSIDLEEDEDMVSVSSDFDIDDISADDDSFGRAG